jgi:hypothetical protein
VRSWLVSLAILRVFGPVRRLYLRRCEKSGGSVQESKLMWRRRQAPTPSPAGNGGRHSGVQVRQIWAQSIGCAVPRSLHGRGWECNILSPTSGRPWIPHRRYLGFPLAVSVLWARSNAIYLPRPRLLYLAHHVAGRSVESSTLSFPLNAC